MTSEPSVPSGLSDLSEASVPSGLSEPKVHTFIFYPDSNLPNDGWIHECCICRTQTAHTDVVDESIHDLVCTHVNYKYNLDQCRMFMCFQCKKDKQAGKISNKALYKYCVDYLKEYY